MHSILEFVLRFVSESFEKQETLRRVKLFIDTMGCSTSNWSLFSHKAQSFMMISTGVFMRSQYTPAA